VGGGPKRRVVRVVWAQVFFFHSFILFTNIYIHIYVSTGLRTHPRYNRESVGRIYTYILHPHPRSKREPVGYYLLLDTHGPTLAANASRWAVFCDNSSLYPTLAPNASWWGFFFLHYIYTDPPSCLVGRFHTNTPPSLQMRVGGGIFIFIFIVATSHRCEHLLAG
jgi:hypothetical protein